MPLKEKKVAIVTGGGSGLGLAIAEKFVTNNIQNICNSTSMIKTSERTCLAVIIVYYCCSSK